MLTVNECIVRKPTDAEKEVCRKWPIWTCDVSQFEWEYTQTEKCLILEGRVTVSDRLDTGGSITFGPGDYVVFPTGLKCVWNITESVKKHYEFE